MVDGKTDREASALPRSSGIAVLGRLEPSDEAVLAPEALEFVARLERRFRAERARLLALRRERQAFLDAGGRLGFLPETRAVREGDWKVASIPADLRDRRVEITGPVDRKMVINALNSGANVFMADFEDANAPTWRNLLEGQANLIDAARRRIRYVAPDTGKEYRLAERTATLLVRPRGWHLPERHLLVDGEAASASLFDFGLAFFHNARTLLERGSGPYFYLPKMESHLEARLWNEVFLAAQEALGIPRGTIRATVLIETLPAAFEMEEILYELREHSSGLNCGRWDYIFSFIKKNRSRPDCVLPDRASVTMDRAFLRAYSLLLIRTCHRRGAHAMGGMAAQIPIKADPDRNRVALEKVRADKRREAGDGHDGTWVAHPGLVETARSEFDAVLRGPHQIDRLREDVAVGAAELLAVPEGRITEAGLRQNLDVGVRYLEAWLRGIGCVPLYDLMEDAATAEISRTQVWQWVRHGARLEDGRRLEESLVRRTLEEQIERMRGELGSSRFEAGRFGPARELFERLILSPQLEDFLTLPAYELLIRFEEGGKENP